MESSFTFLRVRGIEIGANWSWLFVFALLTWSLSSAFFPRTYPGLPDAAYLVMGLVTGIAFFASILLHELGHAFRALKEGMRIEGITLWLFGGVAKFTGMFPSAGAEFRIAIAGPLVSVGLMAGFGAAAFVGAQLDWPDAVRGVVDYLARINGILVAFNLVPALPLDGGRVLRAWLWHRQESFAAATVSASKAGRAFAFMLIAIGVLGFFSGAGIGGLWFVFLGWFLLQAAQSEAQAALLRRTFSGLRVADIMTPNLVVVSPTTPVRDFLALVIRSRHSTYPVVDEGRLCGLVSLRMAGSAQDDTLVSEVMLRGDDVPTVTPDTDVLDALDRIRSDPGRAVVVDDGRIAGILSASDVARAVEIGEVVGAGRDVPARRAGLGVWIVVGVLMAVAAGALYRPPVAVFSPGVALDVTGDVTIEGITVHPVSGRYLLTSVSLDQPNAIGMLIALARPDREIVALSSVFPAGQDPEQFLDQQRSLFTESRMIAAAAAASAIGMSVEVVGDGARVASIVRGAPAARALEEGDVIVAIDGRKISRVSDVRDVVRARPAGSQFSVTVERGARTVDVTVRSAQLPVAEGSVVGIGVFLETRNLDVRLPFDIEFRERDIGGPSAGLAYALAIADLLDQGDRSGGRSIAATGTIDFEGAVGAVGGLSEKAAAAQREGADVFLVPDREVDEARRSGLTVVGVGSLRAALDALSGLG